MILEELLKAASNMKNAEKAASATFLTLCDELPVGSSFSYASDMSAMSSSSKVNS